MARHATPTVVAHKAFCHYAYIQNPFCAKMKIFSLAVALFVASQASVGNAWSTKPGLFPRRVVSSSMARRSIRAAASAAAATPEGDSSKQLTPAEAKKEERRKQDQAGRRAFCIQHQVWRPQSVCNLLWTDRYCSRDSMVSRLDLLPSAIYRFW